MRSTTRLTWGSALLAVFLVALPWCTEPAQAVPCGPFDITFDPCLLVCPKSDAVFKVTVKDPLGNPVCLPVGGIWLDLSQCQAIPCPGEEPAWPKVFPDSCNAQGVHFFTVDAGSPFCTLCEASIVINGIVCQFVPVHFFDVTGDLCVTAVDFQNQICNDYNCNGLVDANDMAIFNTHLGHCCTQGPCPGNGQPFCDSTRTDPCLLICPKSDVVFKVVTKDSCGNPVCSGLAASSVWLDFSGCPARPCPGEEPNWPIVFPDSCDPTTGTNYFTVDAGALDCTECDAKLFVRGAFCRAIPTHFLDINGDLCVGPLDFIQAPCTDYNCDGVLDAIDVGIFNAHNGHCCTQGPCPPGRPYCDSVIAPNCMQICPRSDILYTVLVRDSCGNPVCAAGSPDVYLDFSQCTWVTPCPNEEPAWPRVFPDSCDALGNHFFHVDASEVQCLDCFATLYIRGVPCRTIQTKFLDTDGDRCVTPADWKGQMCNDYDCNGIIDVADRNFFNSHLCHCCNGSCLVHLTGDVNVDGLITSADIIALVNYVFKSGLPPRPCIAAGDVNCDGVVNSADIIKLVNYVFKGGPPPCNVCTIVPTVWNCCPPGP